MGEMALARSYNSCLMRVKIIRGSFHTSFPASVVHFSGLSEPQGTKNNATGAKSGPKGAQSEPKGAKSEPRRAKTEPKRSKSEPKGEHWMAKMQ